MELEDAFLAASALFDLFEFSQNNQISSIPIHTIQDSTRHSEILSQEKLKFVSFQKDNESREANQQNIEVGSSQRADTLQAGVAQLYSIEEDEEEKEEFEGLHVCIILLYYSI